MIELNRNIPFVAAVVSEDVATAVHLLVDAERTHGVLVTYLLEEKSEEFWNDVWIKDCLFPFLSDTHLVATASDLIAGCNILNSAHQYFSASWRDWGGVLADWANKYWVERPEGYGKTTWTKAKRPWEYLDFYMTSYLDYLVKDYEHWVRQIHAVVAAKDREYGLHI